MNIDGTGSTIKYATICFVELIEFRKKTVIWYFFSLEMQEERWLPIKNYSLLATELGKCLLFCFWLGGKAHET